MTSVDTRAGAASAGAATATTPLPKPAFVSPTESLLESTKAFYRDLPRLIREHPGRWAAYYRSECVKVGKRQELLYQYCLDCGYDKEDFIVLYVEDLGDAPIPDAPGIVPPTVAG
jgi:hypothetical protein